MSSIKSQSVIEITLSLYIYFMENCHFTYISLLNYEDGIILTSFRSLLIFFCSVWSFQWLVLAHLLLNLLKSIF